MKTDKDIIPEDAVYIGRAMPHLGKAASPFQNPEKLRGTEDRADCLVRYMRYMVGKPELITKARKELRGKSLVCWCSPSLCHGMVLMLLANGSEP